MPIRLNHPIRPLSRVVRLESDLKVNDLKMMAWWYCGIYKNSAANSQPHILVAFREIGPEGLGDKIIHRRVPLTALGQVRIGSIWKNQECQSTATFELDKFDVMISKDTWRVVSFNEALLQGDLPPYPSDIHPLQYEGDKNWMIEFDLQSGGKLIIPCIEFFARCYGRSAELKRALATYPWCEPTDTHNSRIYAPLDEPEEPGQWKVKLRRRMVNGDIVFLAHAKYDPYTQAAAKSIYAQIETKHDPRGKFPAFIKVAPWFQGPAEIKVSGIRFDNGKSFLALQVNGCSSPQGALIIRDRENSNRVSEGAAPGAREAWAGTPERGLVKPPEIVDLTSDEEPDHSTGSIEIEDDSFEELGEQRVVIDRRRGKAESKTREKKQGPSADKYSGGEPSGNGKAVGYASIHARPVLESQGALRDAWNAMLFLQKKYPDKIEKVQWFTWEGGFKSYPEPQLIGLNEFDKEDDIKTDVRNWPYFDVASRRSRGILVTRLIFRDKWVCILEIQRRPRTKKDANGVSKESEESFKGLVCIPQNMDEFRKWLAATLDSIRYLKGIVQSLEGKHIENCMSFSHSHTKNEQVSGETAVLNALGKVKIRL